MKEEVRKEVRKEVREEGKEIGWKEMERTREAVAN